MDNPDQHQDTPEPQLASASQRTSRPFSVTLLALGVLIITAVNLVRLVLSVRDWGFLTLLPGVSPLYIAATGFIWTLIGLFLLWGLWKAKAWASRLMQAVALTYALYYWLDQVFLENHAANGTIRAIMLPINWPFAAGITVACLAYTAWTLNRRVVKAYFGQLDVVTDQSQNSDDTA